MYICLISNVTDKAKWSELGDFSKISIDTTMFCISELQITWSNQDVVPCASLTWVNCPEVRPNVP